VFDYEDFVTRIDDMCVGARYWSHDAEQNMTAAIYQWGLGNDHLCLFETMKTAQSLQKCTDYLAPFKNLLYGLWNLERLGNGILDDFTNLCNGEEYELTLVKMIEAYIAADDDHRSAQRLLFDAYQASMYDKPFDKEYHANWVQRFRSWA